MNSIIKRQLEQVKSVNIDFKDSDTFIKIPKQTEIINKSVVIGGVYRINYNDSIYEVELLSNKDGYEFLGVEIIDGKPAFRNQFHKTISEDSFKVIEKC